MAFLEDGVLGEQGRLHQQVGVTGGDLAHTLGRGRVGGIGAVDDLEVLSMAQNRESHQQQNGGACATLHVLPPESLSSASVASLPAARSRTIE